MKKIATFVILTAFSAVSTFAQGTIVYGNSSQSAFKILATLDHVTTNVVGTASGIAGLGAASVRIQLLVGTNGSASSDLVPVTATTGNTIVTNTSSAIAGIQGTFTGGSPVLNTIQGAAVTGAGYLISYMYVAWSINTGANSYAQALQSGTGFVGQSALISGFALGGGTISPPATFGTGATQIPFLLLTPVPEPTTIALLGLGAASLLVFRRRKE